MTRDELKAMIQRQVKIDVCKDGTVSYRLPGINRRLNDNAAIPVYAVDTEKQAQQLQARFCRLQYRAHPDQPGRPWYKLSKIGDGTDPAMLRPDGLEIDDLDGVRDMFHEWFLRHREEIK